MTISFERALNELKRIVLSIEKQDNRATADPIFCVQEKNRFYGVDRGYTENFVWINDFSEEEYEEDTIEYLEMEKLRNSLYKDPDGWRKVGYEEYYYTSQTFLTEAAAIEYIEKNKHNLSSPRIYVDSAYRNYEIQSIRLLFQDEKLMKKLIEEMEKENENS